MEYTPFYSFTFLLFNAIVQQVVLNFSFYLLFSLFPLRRFRRARRGDAPPRTDGSEGSKISPYVINVFNFHKFQLKGVKRSKEKLDGVRSQ